MIYTKVGNRYLSDVPILTRMMIIGWGFLQSIGQLKESKIPIIKFLTVPSSTVHLLLVRKWDNGQKRRRRSLQRKSLFFFTNDLIRKGLRRSSPAYFPEALQPFNCQLCMSIKLVASKSRKLEGQMKSKNMDFLDKKRIQIDGISHKDETCNALGWVKKNLSAPPLPHFMYY